MKAAVENRSIEAVCADLTDVVDSNALREALNQALQVEDLREHEMKFNAALADWVEPNQVVVIAAMSGALLSVGPYHIHLTNRADIALTPN